MSARVYSGPRLDRGGGPTGLFKVVPWIFAGATVVGQIAWVLVSGDARALLTVVTVITFFLASATHAYVSRGLAWTAGYLGISLSVGWGIEALGTATQFPFGDYSYTDALGPAVLGVPLVIPLAWAMMSYPCLLAAQRIASKGLATALTGGVLFASWDLFLDPQMVGEGYWIWHRIDWTLPGISGIPLQNFLGWLLTACALMYALDRMPRKIVKDGVPIFMLSWIYLSNIVAAVIFFGEPAVALWGGACMGVVLIPWWWRGWSQPRW
ncbi:MAG: carotenoid biosynthesis protein [Actinobacteria bacterium]|uniref:Unannotated protein n=1 Tax=freshwater metagenome TaxID=449393 RepID=A0A6J7E315_9ZZZZ|nr:carotenoid biosynthesis protein [Actinomycetota bacterium]